MQHNLLTHIKLKNRHPPRHQGTGDTHRILRRRRQEDHPEEGGEHHPDGRLQLQGQQQEASLLVPYPRLVREDGAAGPRRRRQPRADRAQLPSLGGGGRLPHRERLLHRRAQEHGQYFFCMQIITLTSHW